MKPFFKELIRKILEYKYRIKGLNYILYILVVFWIREAATLSVGEQISNFCEEVKKQYPLESWQYLSASAGEILFAGGSYIILALTSGLILYFGYLKRKELQSQTQISVPELLDAIKKETPKDKKILTIPPPKTSRFIGREEELQELDNKLKEKDRVVLVNGLGGIGKTEVCRHYFWENSSQYTALGWINYLGSLKESFATQFQIEAIPMSDNETTDERFAKILHHLANLELPAGHR